MTDSAAARNQSLADIALLLRRNRDNRTKALHDAQKEQEEKAVHNMLSALDDADLPASAKQMLKGMVKNETAKAKATKAAKSPTGPTGPHIPAPRSSAGLTGSTGGGALAAQVSNATQAAQRGVSGATQAALRGVRVAGGGMLSLSGRHRINIENGLPAGGPTAATENAPPSIS